jgi:hypothetical protein
MTVGCFPAPSGARVSERRCMAPKKPHRRSSRSDGASSSRPGGGRWTLQKQPCLVIPGPSRNVSPRGFRSEVLSSSLGHQESSNPVA